MNPLKLKLLNELMDHLSGSQGSDLKSMLDESRKPKEEEEIPGELGDEGDPKGLKIESVELSGKPKSFDEKADHAIADASDGGETLGEAIGYPGFKKKKKPIAMLGVEASPVGGGDHDREMSDDELEELMKRLV